MKMKGLENPLGVISIHIVCFEFLGDIQVEQLQNYNINLLEKWNGS